MSEDLERLLRDAFEASASRVTPHDLDTDRERDLRRVLAAPLPPERTTRRSLYVATAGLAAAAMVVGAVVVTHEPDSTAQLAGEPSTSSPSNEIGLPQLPSSQSSAPRTAPATPSRTATSVGGQSRPQPTRSAATSSGPTREASVPPPTSASSITGTSRPTAEQPTVASTAAPGSVSGPLAVPSEFVAQGEMSSIPMPPDLTYVVVRRSSGYVQIRVSNAMQLTRYLDNNTALGGWPRDAGGYHSPSSTMAASVPTAVDSTSEAGLFSLFVDTTDQPTSTASPTSGSSPSAVPPGSGSGDSTATDGPGSADGVSTPGS
ncbi:hypothetical protein [Luteipulveratus flavus]|uniref:Uncharacterized protein n=1 Tax=Luteipulveratus flavus TaxID=3031728 RepID=A0ABT6C3H2_9MICO|nr:hypothetical protein [Luteipulveratus sp. YIM 133296]MDF8262847.1 hypothetical protein [Luteipulveratus sp. YIM 133296]